MRLLTPVVLLGLSLAALTGRLDVPEPVEDATLRVLSGPTTTAEEHAERYGQETPGWTLRVRSLGEREGDPAGWCPESLLTSLCTQVRA